MLACTIRLTFVLDNIEEEVWSDSEEESNCCVDDSQPDIPESLESNSVVSNSEQALVRRLVLFLLALQSRFYLTDSVLDLMFRFLKVFFTVLGKIHKELASMGECIPPTLYVARKRYKENSNKVRHYVACKKCHSLYNLPECLEGNGTNKKPKGCVYALRFKNNRRPKVCGSPLLKTVELSSGKKIFYPIMTYCYVDLKSSLQNVISQENFIENCEKWKSRTQSPDTYYDIYDGNIWNKFINYGGKPFLSEKYSFGLMVNLDWFQPYKHLTYSVGVMYLTILNLPREIRYKMENTCIVGILPGPNEPERDVNSYIEPLVKDLLEFWEGVDVMINDEKHKVRCAVLCVSCDLPAGRKLCGFLGHSARLGCSKCTKEFGGSFGARDYSGFNRSEWKGRSASIHRKNIDKIKASTTKTQRNKLESYYGCRYSCLLELPYFDPPVMLVVDAMHNLFLGLGKHHLHKVWIGNGLLSNSDFEVIQWRVNNMKTPADIGRIPSKIQSGFSAFTADQFKNWIIHYSIIALRGLLPTTDDLECWRHLVLACRIFSQYHISKEKVKLADALLLQFCKRTERQYGKNVITPNMHMSCHLYECVCDYGPPHSFWLYAFERFNGIVGSLPNNNKSIEIQMMNRFLNDKHVMSSANPELFNEEFGPVTLGVKNVGSLAYQETSSSFDCSIPSIENLSSVLILPKYFKKGILEDHQLLGLAKLYSLLYSISISDVCPNSTFQEYSHLTFNGMSLGSDRSRFHNSSLVMIEWRSDLFGQDCETASREKYRPAKINFFAKHSAIIRDKAVEHLVVSVDWFKYHPEKNICGKPVTVWENDIFELPGVHSIIPIQLVKFRTVSLVDKLNDTHGSVLFVSPIILFE